MLDSLAGDLVNRILSGPFCCVIVIAPGLLIPLYRWLKSILNGRQNEGR